MPKINCSEIPAVELRNVCRTFCKAMDRSIEDKSQLDKLNRRKSSKEVDSLAHAGKANNRVAAGCSGNSYTDSCLQ